MQFSRSTKSSLIKIRKRYFCRCNIFSLGIFSFLIITFCIGFTRTEKKYVKVTDDGICNRKMEFKAKRKLMKMNKNYKKVDEKISRVWKYKEIVTKYDLYNSAFKSLFSQITRIFSISWNLFFLANFYA